MESNIAKLRKAKDINQKELGDAIGMSQQAISRMERDRSKINGDVAVNLADYFGVSTDIVLGYKKVEDEMVPGLSTVSEANISKDKVILLIEKTNSVPRNGWMLVWNTIKYLRGES